MHEIIDFLHDAVSREAREAIWGCYIVRDGHIYARNTLGIAAVVDSDEFGADFAVDAATLDTALKRMKEIDAITIGEDAVLIKSGRLRSTIRLVRNEPPPAPIRPDAWSPVPKNFSACLRDALRFSEDHVAIGKGHILGYSRSLIKFDLPGLEVEGVLHKNAVKFLVAHSDPQQVACDGNTMSFDWGDRWCQLNLANANAPDATGLLRNEPQALYTPITKEWRESFADAAATSGDKLAVLTAKGWLTANNNSTTEIEFETGLPDDHKSAWNVDMMKSVMEIADAWTPLLYPRPAFFKGENFRGIVPGRAL